MHSTLPTLFHRNSQHLPSYVFCLFILLSAWLCCKNVGPRGQQFLFICLKCTVQRFLSIFTELCNHHHNQFQNIFITPQKPLYSQFPLLPRLRQPLICFLSLWTGLFVHISERRNPQRVAFCYWLFPLSLFSRITAGEGISVSFAHILSAKLKTEPDPWTADHKYVWSKRVREQDLNPSLPAAKPEP